MRESFMQAWRFLVSLFFFLFFIFFWNFSTSLEISLIASYFVKMGSGYFIKKCNHFQFNSVFEEENNSHVVWHITLVVTSDGLCAAPTVEAN